MKKQDCPPHLHDFLELLTPLIPKYDLATVWDDFLTAAISQFNVPAKWGNQRFEVLENQYNQAKTRYSAKEWPIFGQLFNEYVRVMAQRLLTPLHYKAVAGETVRSVMLVVASIYEYKDSTDWYDALGDFYMELTSNYKSSRLGQFFTPTEICNLMNKLVGTEEPGNFTINNRRGVNEPACGSGRMILPVHAGNPGISFFSLQDIDPICCKMAVLNCLIHGVPGEVVCCNSLDPDDFRWAYRINRFLYSYLAPVPEMANMPHLWPIEQEQCQIWQFWQQRLRDIESGEFDPIAHQYGLAA